MTHTEKVERIAKQVALFYKSKKQFYIFHGSTNSTRIQDFRKANTIDTSDFTDVLNIDSNKLIARVEPNVPMDKLVKATMAYGLLPKVVMEFPGITVGGGISGVAGESSSFKWGLFGQICDNIDIITPDGKLRTASRNTNQELYQGIGGSFGTLGIITAVDVECIPIKKYVNLTYIPVKSFQDAIDTIMQESTIGHDYIDGIQFSKNRGVIMVGTLSDTKIGKVQRFSRSFDPWFYIHANKHTAKKHTESIPVTDYLFRYDRGGFWVGKYAFELFHVPFNAFMRFVLNPMLHTRKLYEALQISGASQQNLVQDLGIPLNNAVSFMEFVDTELSIYPLWLCPLTPTNDCSEFQLNSMKTAMCINVGVWGNTVTDYTEFLRQNRALEHEVMRLGGKKWFYAHAYYTEQEFWKIYNKTWYDNLRKKYNASHLASVYDKVVVKKRHPLRIKKGAWASLFGVSKLKIR